MALGSNTYLLITLSFSLFVFAQSQNLYQSCSNIYASSSSNPTNPPAVAVDWANLTLPFDQYYSVNITYPTGAFYFNVCAGTSKCNGNLACFIHHDGREKIFASANFAGFYYVDQYYDQVEGTFHAEFNAVFILQLECDSSVIGIDIDDYDYSFDRFIVSGSSAAACPFQGPSPQYKPPTYYSSFSAPIYMKGRIPFFYNVNTKTKDDEFIGTINYSSTYGLLLNGTFSNSEGGTNQVAFFYSKTISGYAPGVAFNWAHHGRCEILPYPTTRHYLKDIFSASNNPQVGLPRDYTSIYFSNGTTFPVNVYVNSEGDLYNQYRIIQREDNGLPVYIGAFILDPWMTEISAEAYWIGSYQSEIDWTQISTDVPESLFTPPSEWGCPFGYYY